MLIRKSRMSYLLVFVGGGLGATLRHFINVICARCMGTGFPWGTVIINITGSTVMGLIAGYLAFKGEASQPWRLFLMTGILGGYTTFSAYSLDAALPLRARRTRSGSALRGRLGRSSRLQGCSAASRWSASSPERQPPPFAWASPEMRMAYRPLRLPRRSGGTRQGAFASPAAHHRLVG